MRDEAPKIIETLTVRRAKIADADKIRYRVYTSPTEFVAVIAESALMAVKVSGIHAPFKIIRDFPTEGIAIEARRMAAIEEVDERVSLSKERRVVEPILKTELPAKSDVPNQPFVAVGLADLRNRRGVRERILPPELVHEIIEQHSKTVKPEMPVPEDTPQAALPEPSPEPMTPEIPAAPVMADPIIDAPRELSVEERIHKLADEMQLPQSTTNSVQTSAAHSPVLSDDEVDKLLNPLE